MAASASSGSSQHLTLDHTSFEKLLAAAWVLQCLHDQLHPEFDGGEAVAQPVSWLKQMEAARSALPERIQPDVSAADVVEPQIVEPEIVESEIGGPDIGRPT